MGARETEILRGAMGLPAEQRAAYVALRCGGDSRLREEITRMLESQNAVTIAGVDGTVDVPPETGSVRVCNDTSNALQGDQRVESESGSDHCRTGPSSNLVRRIGRYKVLRVLGEGGMGVVYLAQQEHPSRQVALKVVRSAALSGRALRRFELESQVLARLQHPGIAQVYEAGTASEGEGSAPLPFFAMEYVQGATLTDDANRRGLDVPARLELFARVCDAVQHAHQKGVVHRDLKPGNVLVDESGQPKVLDFGVARTLESESGVGAGVSMHTEAGQLLGTVPYMSPEQLGGGGTDAHGGPRDVDTRSDVYTLGVMLFELLTGRLPHDVGQTSIAEAARTIAEEEATRISSLDRSLRGDVETIVRKALEKDRSRRYQSASELAEDLRRYLRDEPIAARPPSRAYQIRKFARRNRGLVLGVVAAVVVLMAGVVASSIFAVIAKQNEARAEAAATDAITVTEFLQDMLASANPDGDNLDRTEGVIYVQSATTVREVLDRSSARIAALDGQPRVQVPLLNMLARSYRSLGELEMALEHAESCANKTAALFGDDSYEAMSARTVVGTVLLELNKLPEAEKISRATVGWLERNRGSDDPELHKSRSELSRVLFEAGKAKEALPISEAAYASLKRLKGDAFPVTMQSCDVLSSILSQLGEFERAENIVRHNLAAREAYYGKDSMTAAYSMTALANALQRQGKHEESIDLLKRVLSIRRAALAADHPRVQLTVVNLAVAYVGAGMQKEAKPLLREALDATLARLGESHPRTLSAMGNLAYCLEDLGELDEAETLFRRSVELGRLEQATRGETADNMDFWLRLNNLGALLLKAGKLPEAELVFAEAIERSASRLSEDHYILSIFLNNHGRTLTRLQKFDAAEPLLLKSHRLIESKFGPDQIRTRRAVWRLAELYKAMNKPEEEARWRALLPSGFEDDR